VGGVGHMQETGRTGERSGSNRTRKETEKSGKMKKAKNRAKMVNKLCVKIKISISSDETNFEKQAAKKGK
jgi:hypothetical protein